MTSISDHLICLRDELNLVIIIIIIIINDLAISWSARVVKS